MEIIHTAQKFAIYMESYSRFTTLLKPHEGFKECMVL